MGLFSKKKEIAGEETLTLPELPRSSEFALLPKSKIPDVPSGLPEIELDTLPILPNSEAGKKFNQEAIKEAINQPMSEPQLQSQKLTRPIPTRELEEKKIPEISDKKTLEPPIMISPKIHKHLKKIEPVFVRLDKFQSTTETFEEIQTKIEEIEELLKKTRDIKIREEQELAEWEREIQIIKSRIDLIDKNIFNKLNEFE